MLLDIEIISILEVKTSVKKFHVQEVRDEIKLRIKELVQHFIHIIQDICNI